MKSIGVGFPEDSRTTLGGTLFEERHLDIVPHCPGECIRVVETHGTCVFDVLHDCNRLPVRYKRTERLVLII